MTVLSTVGILLPIVWVAVFTCFFRENLRRWLYRKFGWFKTAALASIAAEEREIRELEEQEESEKASDSPRSLRWYKVVLYLVGGVLVLLFLWPGLIAEAIFPRDSESESES